MGALTGDLATQCCVAHSEEPVTVPDMPAVTHPDLAAETIARVARQMTTEQTYRLALAALDTDPGGRIMDVARAHALRTVKPEIARLLADLQCSAFPGLRAELHADAADILASGDSLAFKVADAGLLSLWTTAALAGLLVPTGLVVWGAPFVFAGLAVVAHLFRVIVDAWRLAARARELRAIAHVAWTAVVDAVLAVSARPNIGRDACWNEDAYAALVLAWEQGALPIYPSAG